MSSAQASPRQKSESEYLSGLLPPEKPSVCDCRTAVMVIIALAAIAVLVVGILGMQDVIGIGEIGSKVMVGLSAGVLGGLLINTIKDCYTTRKRVEYQTVS